MRFLRAKKNDGGFKLIQINPPECVGIMPFSTFIDFLIAMMNQNMRVQRIAAWCIQEAMSKLSLKDY